MPAQPCTKRHDTHCREHAVALCLVTLLATSLVDAERVHAFELSFVAGGQDPQQQFLGGTEVLSLVPHNGALFAGVGYWKDVPGADPSPGAQILRKDSEDGPWMQDARFGAGYSRVDSLKSLTLTTDLAGVPLQPPVHLLIAGLSDNIAPFRDTAWVRHDATGLWRQSEIWPEDEQRTGSRAFIVHRDKVTQRDLVFAGAADSVYKAAYDQATGQLNWSPQPELVADYRTLAFARANGDLYVSISDALYRRVDGPGAHWVLVWQWDGGPRFNQLRGLTAIPNPAGTGELLLGAREIQKNWMVSIDPSQGHQIAVEVDVRSALEARWGGAVPWTIAAYNNIVPVTDPQTGETVHLLSLQAAHPDPVFNAPRAFYLVREVDGRYRPGTVHACGASLPGSPAELRAVRAIVQSPFDTGADPYIYMAGFDANFLDAHNTAWIYRARLSRVLADPPDCTEPGG